MLPPLIERLKDLGIADLKIVFALGTHRRMTAEEERLLLQGCTSLPYMQHDPKNCVSLGETRRGTPVEILESVASSDLIVATGNIEYHYYAGYSGGAKAVLPGVSSERSVIKNHELMRDPRSTTGRLDSPVRQDMEDAAKIAGLDFILNVVLNGKKEIVQSVAGDFISAHRMGAATVDRMYRRPVEPAEIVVTCAGAGPKTSTSSRRKRLWTMPRMPPCPEGASSWWRSAARGWAIPSSSAGQGKRHLPRIAGSASAGSMSSAGTRPPSWPRSPCSIT